MVPELAGRSHLELVDRLAVKALNEAGVNLSDIELFAGTVGPGLVGSLLVGANYARGLAIALDKPFRAVHHVEAHLWSAELEAGKLPLPFLVLLVSGGHTLLLRVDGLRRYTVLGRTLDDALGEAYDKVGKLAGLAFPAGGEVDRLASSGNPRAYDFPRAMDDGSLNFSFSGLKTAYLYRIKALPLDVVQNDASDLLASFQATALDSVVNKVRRAIRSEEPKAIVAAGGVAANSRLRFMLTDLANEFHIASHFPSRKLCMDNAGMIGYLAWKLEQSGITDPADWPVRPRWPIESLIQPAGSFS